jgi:TonB-linked SusC/RagA family outer membrane protein
MGGNGNTQYHISGGYFKQQGTVIGSDFNRYSGNINIRSKVSDRFTVAAKALVGAVHQTSPDAGGSSANPITAAMHILPFISPYNPDGSFNIDPEAFPSVQYNPLYMAAYNVNTMNQLKAVSALDGELRILNNLRFTSRIGFDYNTIEEDNYRNPAYGDGLYVEGSSIRSYSRYFHWTWTNMFDYHLDLMRDRALAVNVKAGYQAEAEKDYFSSVEAHGMPPGSTLTVPSNGAIPYATLGYNQGNSLTSEFGVADVTYKGRYVVSGSFRRDGSSRFGADNRYGRFWSVGGTWNAYRERFIEKLSWMNMLKLRFSYGLTGNAGIPDYAAQQMYGYGVSNNYNGMGGAYPGTVGNPILAWEANKQLDLGLDMAFLKNRLTITFDYYTRKADRLLMNQPTSLTTGFTGFINNVGAVRNRGVELAVSGTPVIAGDFKWDLGFNFSRNNNTVLGLVNGRDLIEGNFIKRVGMQLNTFYLRQWAGVDPANGNPLWYKDASMTTTTSNYNSAALVAKYASVPKAFGGITSAFSYRGISLSGMLYYNYGNYVQDYWARITASDGAVPSYNHLASQLNAWSKPGDITNVPVNVYNNANNSARMSSRFLYKGDYVRLKEITLSYVFPKTALAAMKIQGCKVYVQGMNLLTWVKDKNLPYDPEQGVSGQTNYNIAVPRIFTAGLNIQF